MVRLQSVTYREKALFMAFTAGLLGIGVLAGADSPLEYCGTLVDYLGSRPCQSPAGAIDPVEVGTRLHTVEERVLQWGREQGIAGLEGSPPDNRRGAALASVYALMARKYMGAVVLPENAPDVGVKVIAGEPRVVMFAPEGNVNDRAASISKIGYERWGHHMGPSIHRLRDGRLLARVYVGGEGYNAATLLGRIIYAGTPEQLNYLSVDGGEHWLHFASFAGSESEERPYTDIASLLAEGEEIRYKRRTMELEVDDPRVKPYSGNYFRLGDLPREMQWMPIFSRRPGEERWKEDKAFWDPDTLLLSKVVPIKEGAGTRLVRRLSGFAPSGIVQRNDGSFMVSPDAGDQVRPMSELRADGTFDSGAENHIVRSFDRGRTWKYTAAAPRFTYQTFFHSQRAHVEPRFQGGAWIALYRTTGIYWTGGGPVVMRRSTDEGKTWSEPTPIRPCSGGTLTGLMLVNGIAVRTYGRPGAFLTFCADGKGERWGNDVILIRPTKGQEGENTCNNGSFVATGPDRFVHIYSRYDMPDPWGQPRLAILAQEFVVSKK
jgi:hypothetical protein